MVTRDDIVRLVEERNYRWPIEILVALASNEADPAVAVDVIDELLGSPALGELPG